MEEQRQANASDLPALEAIWLSSFPEDSPADIAFFWESGFNPEQAVVHTVAGRPVSMLFLLPAALSLPGHPYTLPVGYVYAAATLPEFRGRGIFSSLLEAAHNTARRSGMRATFLRPAQPSLETFYARLGYRPAFRADIRTMTRRDIEKQAAETAARARRLSLPTSLRREWLGERHIPSIEWDRAVWRFAIQAVRGAYWEGPGWSALCAPDAEHILVRELLCGQELLPSFYRHLCDRYQFDTCTIRAPSCDGDGTAFGMIHYLDAQAEALSYSRSSLYMGLALD